MKTGKIQAIQAHKPPQQPSPPKTEHRYPRVEQDGKYWVLKSRNPDGTIGTRKFVQKEFADRALFALIRKH